MTTAYVMYIETEEGSEGEAWFNEKKEIIGWYSSNDANWRDEYLDDIFKQLGVKVKRITAKQYPKLYAVACKELNWD